MVETRCIKSVWYISVFYDCLRYILPFSFEGAVKAGEEEEDAVNSAVPGYFRKTQTLHSWSSTNRKNSPIQQNHCNFWTSNLDALQDF